MADSGGDVSNIDSWLTHQIRKEIEISFFGKRNPTFEELQGIFLVNIIDGKPVNTNFYMREINRSLKRNLVRILQILLIIRKISMCADCCEMRCYQEN